MIRAFFKKLGRFLKFPFILFFSVLLLPSVLFVRLLRPFVLIRFGSLMSTRLGHYAVNTELYLCEKEAGLQPKHALDIFFNDRIICNYQLKKMWDRTLNVCQITRLQRPLYIANRIVPGYKKHIISLSREIDVHGHSERATIHLLFTADEEKKGYEELSKMGVPADAKFICFHSRDSSYLETEFPGVNWYYHNYRDSNIDNFIPAAEELVKRGYYVLRIGAETKKAIKFESPRIVDYSTKFRNAFLDIFLGAKCFFYLGDASGRNAVSTLFRRPIVTTNAIPFEYPHTWSSRDLFIPKKLWLKKDRRLMTFREILESGAGRFGRTEQYEQAGMEVVENTPEEIRDVTIQMDERLKGSWQTTEEDEELQQRFWALFKSSKFHGVIRSRIGRDFLRQNKDLLE